MWPSTVRAAGLRPDAAENGDWMSGRIKTGVTAHDTALAVAESVRQSAVAGVAQSAAGQAVQTTAEIAWARACVASCVANNGGFGAEPFQTLLRSLGTGGV